MLEVGTAEKVVDRIFGMDEEWEPAGRPELLPHQVPPAELLEGEARGWLLEAGRGAGKTEACARYFTQYMRGHPGARGRIIGPTLGDAVESCIEGPSGLLSVDPDGVTWVPSAPGGSKVKWRNGSEAVVLGTPSPKEVERLRALGNRDIDWWEEAAANAQLQKAMDQALLGLRRGDHPHWVASTTPRPTLDYAGNGEDIKGFRNEDDVVVVQGISMHDNPHNNPDWVAYMERKYGGTRLGKQELEGLVIQDAEGALWARAILDACRVDKAPDLARGVVSLDPAATSGPRADDTGMIVAGIGADGEGYVLADRTCHLEPDGWAVRAIRAYNEFELDKIIGEVNNGGEMVESVIRAQDPSVPFDDVRASRGKQTRAEPVAALFGDGKKRQPKVHIVGSLPRLEDQMCNWVPGEGKSPDRVDAMVWAITYLMLGKKRGWAPL